MNIDFALPPDGTVRDWLDYRAQHDGRAISHLFVDGSQPLTWSQLQLAAANVATHLRGLGIEKGESVALLVPNSQDSIICLFGVLYGGFRATVLNLVAGAQAMGYALVHSRARFVLAGRAQKELLENALVAHASDVVPIWVQNGISWPSETQAEALYDLSAEDDALLMYTSGTTGQPKGVVHSHSSLLAGGWTSVLAHELTPHDRALCVLPIYHINGLCVTIMAPLVSGGAVAVCDRFSASNFWAQCAQNEVSWFSIVPTIVSHLLHGSEEPDAATRERIRFGRSASSALAPDVQRAFESRFGISIVETMGLTETAAQILSNPLPPGVRKIGSPGKAYGNKVAIFSPDFVPLPAELEGEIAVWGPNVMRGYLNDPGATKAALSKDGWLLTGDLGRIDADGYVFVTGRLKELIIKGGENIAPREVDEALYSHPDVIEAAAFARPCKNYGEQVEAAVALREGSNLTQEDLILLCHERLGKFKSPDVVYFLPELPKGPSGKIQRRLLVNITSSFDVV